MSGTLMVGRGKAMDEVDDFTGLWLVSCIRMLKEKHEVEADWDEITKTGLYLVLTLPLYPKYTPYEDRSTVLTITYGGKDYASEVRNGSIGTMSEDNIELFDEWVTLKAKVLNVELSLIGGWL